jgi:TolB-like protein
MARLLRYLVQQMLLGNSRQTQEYAIGLAVFDRPAAAYNTAEDPTVRVQVGRLRQRLRQYYAGPGSHDALEISIPLGAYMPQVHWREAPAGAAPRRLALHPIRHPDGHAHAAAFAMGLHEELLNLLCSHFGEVLMAPATLQPATAATARPGGGNGQSGGTAAAATGRHLVDGSVRVDQVRIRTSMRLVDSAQGRVTWARQFDSAVQFTIAHQEELARSICSALQQHLSS